jgi:hypothetical protein
MHGVLLIIFTNIRVGEFFRGVAVCHRSHGFGDMREVGGRARWLCAVVGAATLCSR